MIWLTGERVRYQYEKKDREKPSFPAESRRIVPETPVSGTLPGLRQDPFGRKQRSLCRLRERSAVGRTALLHEVR